MIREGSGPPLVLLHGVLGSEGMWGRVVPLLAPHHDTIALTALGHRGGNPPTRRPALIADVIDDAQRTLDALGLETAHLAGNSMGGWVALELARRGRAKSVCALSPAGCWPPVITGKRPAADRLRGAMLQARFGRPLLPLLTRFARFRRQAMALNAAYGDRLTPQEFLDRTDDLLGCEVGEDLLMSTEALAALASPPCPITIAWSERDRVLPRRIHEPLARDLIPLARFIVLRDVGHVPMMDDPDLVARTILETTGAKAG